jgi:hypothetical protein
MPSPFPGMNPYLEQADVWHDFHERGVPFIAELLGPQVLPRYIAKIDEHVYIHDLAEESRKFLGRADVGVTPLRPAGVGNEPGVAVIEFPARVTLPAVDREGESYVEIRDRQNRQLVTVIELLSPSNKRPGDDRDQYTRKRYRLIGSGVNLVEIDLLRGNPRMPMTGLAPCDYCVLVSRPEDWPDVGIFPIRLRDPLPPIPIPLRPTDPPVRLDLKRVIDHVYDVAGYGYYVYDGPPDPPLSPDDAAWAAPFVPARPESPA